jgi:uncharacterized protein YndB with AHSA1/START domain
MAPLVETIEVERPPAEVFSYVTDPSRFGEWQKNVVGGHIEGNFRRGWDRGASPAAGSALPRDR